MLAYFWARARRKRMDVAKNKFAPIADEGLKRIAALYRVEAAIQGQSAAVRMKERHARAKPLVDAFKDWLSRTLSPIVAKNRETNIKKLHPVNSSPIKAMGENHRLH